MWLMFFCTAALFILYSAVYSWMRRKGSISGNIRIYIYAVTAVLVLTGVSEFIFDFGNFSGVFMLIGTAAAIEFLIYMIPYKNCTLDFMRKIIAVAVMVEITVFQLPAYRIISGDYTHTVLSAADSEIENSIYDETAGGVAVNGTDEISMTYRNIGKKTGTVRVNIRVDEENDGHMNFFADMTEETGYYYRMKIIDEKIIPDSSMSEYAVVQLSGKSDSMRFRFSGTDENSRCVIESIELNAPVPFDIMPFRVLLIIIFVTFIYACIFSGIMKRSYAQNYKFCRISGLFVTGIAVVLAAGMVLAKIPHGELSERFRLESGDQITEELVTAFEHGSFELPYEPSEELLAMENPYDAGSRYYNETDCLWDHSFYNGRYYSYYGIAPLIFFLPYHLISGYFFPSDIAVMLFSAAGLIFLSMVYSAVVRKFLGGISTGMYISGLVVILASCGIWFSAGRPMFYEIAVSSGFMTGTAGVYFLITSGIISTDREPVKYFRTVLSSLLLGLSVMCRPTLALYALCGCIFYIYGFKKIKGRKEITAYIVCAFLPLVFLGMFQMYYNYARFDSVFEFGIKYSLTVNDFTRNEFHFHYVLVSLYNFLFAPPSFIPEYPYVSAPFSFLGINGYYYKDAGSASGIFFTALPVFGYFLGLHALRKLSDIKNRVKWGIIIGLSCLIMPAAIVCASWESGYAVRYTADFSWYMIMGAFVIIFYLIQKSDSRQRADILTAIMGICAVYSIFVSGTEAYNFAFTYQNFPKYADFLTRLFL
ncbi:MAG: hypothetical protein K2J37_05710 [Ruminococcus sp.]|nr:hypothetical protein [Ruminococcus sp.]